MERINDGIQQAYPNINVVRAAKSPVKGLFEVEAEDGVIFYTDKKGSILAKELFQIEGGNVVSMAEATYAKRRTAHMKGIDHSALISYKPEGESRGEVYVFTDVNCPYCRQFHQRLVPAANKMGVTVSYFAYPVIGGEKSSKQMTSAWCAGTSEQRADSLDTLKNGGTIDENLCENNPIDKHLTLGRKMRISGTPTVLLSNGTKLDLKKFEAELKTHFGDAKSSS